MLTVTELTALVGTAGLDAIDRAARGAVRAGIRAAERARPGAAIEVAYDERFGQVFLGFRGAPSGAGDEPERFDECVAIGLRATLALGARVALGAIADEQARRDGRTRCAAVGDAFFRREAEAAPDEAALRDALGEALRDAEETACRSVWHEARDTFDLEARAMATEATRRAAILERVILSPIAGASKRWALARARDDALLRRAETIAAAHARFVEERGAGDDPHPAAAIEAIEAEIAAIARELDDVTCDAPARNAALQRLLEEVAIALRRYARAEVARALGDARDAARGIVYVQLFLDEELPGRALDAAGAGLDLRRAAEEIRRTLAPLAEATVAAAFDDGGCPTFLEPDAQRMAARGIVEGFWRAFDAAFTAALGELVRP